MNSILRDAKAFNGDIQCWDVTAVEDLTDAFAYTQLNLDFTRWDVTKVISFGVNLFDSVSTMSECNRKYLVNSFDASDNFDINDIPKRGTSNSWSSATCAGASLLNCGGATGPFTATCGETTEGGGAFADSSCTENRVYDSTTSAATTPNDANCCKAASAPFVATCGEISSGGGAFADSSCKSGRVYDSTTSAATNPNDDNCCKAFVATCGEITSGGGAFADSSCTSGRVYDSTKASATTPNDAN
jgi:hypothetical protein